MKHIFIRARGTASARWSDAFPDLALFSSVEQYLSKLHNRGDFCWLDTLDLSETALLKAARALVGDGKPVVVMSNAPRESQAFAVLSVGARGYCHTEAVPEQLQEVGAAVQAGGYWVPPNLVQRLAMAAVQVDATMQQPAAVPEGFEVLTEREYQVAMAVGKGLSNKEIAEQLALGERTIKAHLTTTFEKLQVRDRVQLALAINRLPIH